MKIYINNISPFLFSEMYTSFTWLAYTDNPKVWYFSALSLKYPLETWVEWYQQEGSCHMRQQNTPPSQGWRVTQSTTEHFEGR